MLNQQILQSIECAIAHKCPNEADGTKRCAQCEIGYSFVACEPITLDCGHHICRECGSDFENGILKCKICAKNVKLIGTPGVAADSVFELVKISLAKELKEKYAAAFKIYEGKILIELIN
jgi:hypothetical protein